MGDVGDYFFDRPRVPESGQITNTIETLHVRVLDTGEVRAHMDFITPQPPRIVSFEPEVDPIYAGVRMADFLTLGLAGDELSVTKEQLFKMLMTPLFDMAPLQSQLREYVDLDRLRHSSKELMVIATDWARGMPRIFTIRGMTNEVGYKVLQASAAFTLAFPSVQIYGRRFSGGPGAMATPPVSPKEANRGLV